MPFMIEHGQKVCKLTFERMIERPDFLYGEFIGSSYQRQDDTLSKHFRRPESATPVSEDAPPPRGPNLFDQEDGNADRGW